MALSFISVAPPRAFLEPFVACSTSKVRIYMTGSRRKPLTGLIGNFSEAQSGICHLENINGIVLEKVVEYFYYNEKHRDSVAVPDVDIPSELCLELLMAADYLDT